MKTDIIVNLPFDFVGSVVVPSVAILVSAGIALWLARRERKAGDRSRVRVELGNLSRSLTALSHAASTGVAANVDDAFERAVADTNVLALHLPDSDHVVLKFVVGGLAESRNNGNATVVKASSWLANCVEAWSRGKLSSAEFAAALPTGADKYWEDSPRLSDWATMTK